MSTNNRTTVNQGTGVDESLRAGDVFETLKQLPDLRRFLEAVERSGLATELREPNMRTLFAPVNAAFESQPGDLMAQREQLSEVVAHHIIQGRQTEADLRTTSVVRSIHGDELPVEFHSEGSLFGGARIIRHDIACRNGVIHLIETFAKVGSTSSRR